MKNLKIIICIIIIMIIILTVMIVLLNNRNSSNIIEKESPSIETEPIENADIQKVTDRDTYYTIKYILDTYFEYVNYIDATAKDLELSDISNQQEIIESYTKIGIEGLKNIIDEEYFNQEQTDEQIRKNSLNYKNKDFRIDKIYCQDKTLRKTIYFAYVTLDYDKKITIIIKVDSMSNCFSILPKDYIDNNYYSERDLDKIEIKDIQSNGSNQYEYISVTDKMMAQSYLEDYGNIVLNNIEKSYEMIDIEYKQYKFSTFKEYSDYISNSKKDYKVLRLKEYYINSKDDNTIYVCKDQFGNTYVFKETSIMEYTVQLDDYTLENEEFSIKYKEASYRDKGLLNVDKFFKMINMQDYKAAYNVLDENFKQNYFKTQSDFENYMKSKVFLYNKVEYKEYSNKITDIYTYKVVLTDMMSESQNQVEFNIIIKLLEGTDFVISFEVN